MGGLTRLGMCLDFQCGSWMGYGLGNCMYWDGRVYQGVGWSAGEVGR